MIVMVTIVVGAVTGLLLSPVAAAFAIAAVRARRGTAQSVLPVLLSPFDDVLGEGPLSK